MSEDVGDSSVPYEIHNFRVKLSEVVAFYVRVQHNELHLPRGMRVNVIDREDFGAVCDNFCRRVEFG